MLEPLTPTSRGTTYGVMPSLRFGGARLQVVFGVSIILLYLLVVLLIQAAAAAASFGRQLRRVHC